MDFLIMGILFFVILFPLVLCIVIPIYKNHDKATGGIINHDAMMQKFVYKVNLKRDEIIDLLKIKNGLDELSCTIDLERGTVNFTEYGSNREYYYHIHECNGFSVLQLEQVVPIGMRSHIPLKLNPFMVRKLNAEIIPFSKYGF